MKPEKTIFFTLCLFSALFGVMLLNGCKSDDPNRHQVLKIYNWADYIDEDLLKEFPQWYKEQTGEDVRIVYQVFDMNEVMYTKIALGQEDYDLACPTQAIIERMMRNDLLQPIDFNFDNTQIIWAIYHLTCTSASMSSAKKGKKPPIMRFLICGGHRASCTIPS